MNGSVNSRFLQAAGCLSPPLLSALKNHISVLENKAQEIRLRAGKPLAVVCPDKTCFVTESGGLTDMPNGDLLTVSRADIDATFQRICEYSVYARQREIVGGFVTMKSGHRAGICGTAVTSNGGITNVRDLTSINIRIARERLGCAEKLFRSIRNSPGALICGEPCSGKTTVLRDLARLFSTVDCANVSLIDERGELASVSCGIPQNDVGLCDVFDGYPKAQAMEQALRCMSPQLIICDELGGYDDVQAVRGCVNSGVRLIATAHAKSMTELKRRPALRRLLNTGAFSDIVFLSGRSRAGEVSELVREVYPVAA